MAAILRVKDCCLKSKTENEASRFCLDDAENFKILSVVLLIKVFLIKKACSDLDFSNCTPISLPSNIGKIIEKMIHETYLCFSRTAQMHYISFNLVSEQCIRHLIDLVEDI